MQDRQHLASLVDDFARLDKDIAIVAPRGLRQVRFSYGQLAALCRRFAAELESREIRKGDRVVLWGENSPEWVAAFFGCVLRGVVAVPIDFGSTPRFVNQVTGDVSPKLIVAQREKLGLLNASVPKLALEELTDSITDQTADAIPDLNESDTLQIVFTSGTTGDPKGVVHTHKNVLASVRPIEAGAQKYLKYERLVHPIRILHTLPLSHVFGQFMGLWVPALICAEVHYESRLVAAEIVEKIKNERISVLAAVPRTLDLMQADLLSRFADLEARLNSGQPMKAWNRWWVFRDVHRLLGFKFWAFVCGGASLSAAGEQFWRSLGFVVIQGYGMTETTALVSLNHPFRTAQGTIGEVLPGREVRLSDEGEVLVRGDTISTATWQGGQLQQKESDWLATGDLAEFDDSGRLRFRGRKKDVIVTSSGLNIYPEDLEAALNQQPAVKASAVVETNAGIGPEAVAALIVNDSDDAAKAVNAANQGLAEFQQIRRWVIWPEPDFPRTSTGKVLRREVARRITAGEIASLPQNGAAGELNLDSLGRVQLQAQLEQQYGIALSDSALQEIKTAEDVQEVLKRASSSSAPQPVKAPLEHVYPRWPWSPVMQAIRGVFLEIIALPLVRLLAKPRVVTHVSEWPTKPMLIVANHVTSYDAPFVLYALPGRVRRRIAIAMSGEMIMDWRRARNQGHWFLNLVAPIQYWLVTALFNIFPLPRLTGFRQSFRHAGEAMDRGYNVLVFPEGHRSDTGEAQPFKAGSGLLWKELGTPALPVRIEGLGQIKVQRSRWFRSGKISVHVEPVLQLDPSKTPEELTEVLRQGVWPLR